jgi:Tfp pilus assembly protein PilN
MLKINLFPGPRRKRIFKGFVPKFGFSLSFKDRSIILPSILVGIVFILAISSYFVKRHKINQLEDEIQVAVADSIRYAESIRLINDIKEREGWIRERIEIISRVDQNRYLWSKLLAGVNDALPSVTWLTRLETISPFPNLIFRVDGISFSNIEVANYMRRLERFRFIDEVRLISTKEFKIDEISTMAFALECYYNKEPVIEESRGGKAEKGG